MSKPPPCASGPTADVSPLVRSGRCACARSDTTGSHARYVVAGVADLRQICGPGSTLADASTLWRLLREAGLLTLVGDHAVIGTRTLEEFDAWVLRAKVASRRERNELQRWASEPWERLLRSGHGASG